ncbi:MAG: hypothetical protein JOZ83_16465 [Silvibacterium sp.]|nr:hypothetical protein [Silvibacterium sp.]
MLFRNFYTRNGSSSEDLQRGMVLGGPIANGYDHSHLVSCAVKPLEEPQRALFDKMLTDYDRVLLRFGMHIIWET